MRGRGLWSPALPRRTLPDEELGISGTPASAPPSTATGRKMDNGRQATHTIVRGKEHCTVRVGTASTMMAAATERGRSGIKKKGNGWGRARRRGSVGGPARARIGEYLEYRFDGKAAAASQILAGNFLLADFFSFAETMVLAHTHHDPDTEVGGELHSMFATRYVRSSLPKYKLPLKEIPKDAAYQIISDELMLDGNPRLNLASFVTTWMEPECDQLILKSLAKNYIDMDEYPITTELQDRCVNMLARLYNAPVGDGECGVGASCVGSSEAIMLAGLAFKRKWQNKRKAEGKPYDKPNIVTGSNVQVCWEKFARYFEVELKEVHLTENYYVMDPHKAVEMVDENTICVAAILGSTYNGEFEDVKTLNDLLDKKNKETGWNVGIHVDAASGGFIAPFLYPDLEWDFRLPLVRSINVSGHKYGLVYAGIGWVVWRSKDDLPEELIFHINYLGADQASFTLNFSKGASQIIAQYYQFIRLGFEGYRCIMQNCKDNADALKNGIVKTGLFNILSKDQGVPVVAFSLKDTSNFNEYDLSAQLRSTGWIVPAYTMAPDCKHVTLLRVVVREDFSRTMCERLLWDLQHCLDVLESQATKTAKIVAKALSESAGTKETLNEIVADAVEADVSPLKMPHIFDTVLRAQKAVRLWKQKSAHRSNNAVC
ncbi:hypothetical protein R1flu_006144 [Riccia fluitans]|uniref:Glutamate decarboxylase n=1 Tax=Riccia fluitans TaxID=41844 RepID=A0ABD1YVH3_9MARC